MLKNYDDKLRELENSQLICGIDEAGRGPLAGPVVAAAVVFSPEVNIKGVNDSKKISEKKREQLFDIIIEKSLAYGIGIVDHKTIDEINILQATLKAMKLSTEKLVVTPEIILIDGNKAFKSNIKTKTVIKGDSLSFSIAAASIIAKVTRDRLMLNYHAEFPVYNWKANKGYGTKEHIKAIMTFGVAKYHRHSFLKRILENKQQNI
jgi:ribonuclease HII